LINIYITKSPVILAGDFYNAAKRLITARKRIRTVNSPKAIITFFRKKCDQTAFLLGIMVKGLSAEEEKT